MRYVYLFFVVLVFSCNQQPAKQEPFSSDLNQKDLQGMQTVLNSYYKLKDALVASDSSGVVKLANEMNTAITNYRSALTDSVKTAAMLPYLDTIATSLMAMQSVNNIEKQRIPFQPLSNSLYKALQSVHFRNSGVFQEYCPMAFDNKGAHWLSDNPAIKNPYFGDKMLECGEVTDTL